MPELKSNKKLTTATVSALANTFTFRSPPKPVATMKVNYTANFARTGLAAAWRGPMKK